MYVRVKRQKTTYFLHVEPTDTVLELKQKLQELVDKVRMGWNRDGTPHVWLTVRWGPPLSLAPRGKRAASGCLVMVDTHVPCCAAS